MAADPTPTTVGIIQGDVRLDTDQFHQEIARVRAAVAALREDDPHVRVEADTGEAMARLAEVEAAAEAVGEGRTISVDTTGNRVSTAAVDRAEAQAAMDLARARVLAAQATEALNAAEVEHAGGGFQEGTLRPAGMGEGPSTGSMAMEQRGLAEAHEAAAKAADDAAVAAKREKVVLDGLDAAAKHVAGSLGGFAEAEKKASAASSGSGGGGGYMAIILGIIAALIPMLGPLGGYLIGLTGGFAAMGGAGVLAVLGVARAMAAGTQVGQVYRAGIDSLQNSLHTLEDTAAKATMPGFTQAVATISSALPGLNSQVGVFGGMLGGTVAEGAKTVVDLMTALNPALVAGATAVQDFVRGLDGWATGTEGAQAFGSYIASVMPQVGEVLNHIVTTVGLLLSELAPLGSTMLGVINVAMGLVNVAEGLGPAFAPAVTAALALWGAMKGWGLIAPLLNTIAAAYGPVTAVTGTYVDLLWTEAGVMDAVKTGEVEAAAATVALGEAVDFAAGPVGWIVGGIAALAATLLVASNGMGSATSVTQDYTAAIQQDNGAMGENVRQQAASNLQKSGAADAAAKLGISLKTLTDATMGNATANKAVADATAKANAEAQKHAGTSRTSALVASIQANENGKVTTSIAAQRTALKDQIKAYNDLQTALGGTTIKTGDQLKAQQALAAKYGTDLPTYLAAVAAQKQQAAQAQAATAAMIQENDAAGLLKAALDLLNGKTLGVAEAQTAADAATNSLIDSLKQNGTATDGASKAAVANQQAIQGVVRANQAVAEAIGTKTGSTAKEVASYKASKDAMEENLQKAGLLTKGMKAYIDKLYDLKNLKVPPTKLDVEASRALSAIEAVRSGLQNLDKQHADVYIGVQSTAAGAAGTAGQIARNAGLAYGGTTGIGHAANGVTAGYGTVRGPGSGLSDTAGLWALANGEEVISNRNGQADAWRPLLKAISSGNFRGVSLGGERQAPATIKTVNMGGIHLHSPVAQDPVAAAEDASQMLVAYAGFPL